MVCGSREFVDEARRARKLVGGGMRQAGVLAAAGIVALTKMVERLTDDHANAKKLAEGLANITDIAIDPDQIRTNIVFFDLARKDMTPQQLVAELDSEGVKMLPVGPQRLRAVTHYHITSEDIDYTLGVLLKILG
jgi:threonine aldolase